MPKSKFFRVAVEGATTDGRVIERRWIEQAAKNYNRDTYAARVNLEHIRGLSPMSDTAAEDGFGAFGSYGDVAEVKAEEITLELAGKSVKRLALFASIDALEPLVKLNGRGQKLYSSIEIAPEFADTGEAYLVGLAVTDSPASLGTEMLAFAAGQGEKNPLAGRKLDPANLFTAAEEITLELEAEGEGEDAAAAADPTGIFASLKALVDRFTVAPAAPPVEEPAAPVADPATPSSADFADALREVTAAIEASSKAANDRLDALEAANAARTEAEESAPAQEFTNREPATGGDVAIRTDC